MSTHIPHGDRAFTVGFARALFESGSKPVEAFRFGTEYEKFVVDGRTGNPLPYHGPRGIRALLEHIASRGSWSRYEELGNLLALQRGMESVSLEPGGQVELSGAPLDSLHLTARELQSHIDDLESFCATAGAEVWWTGLHPHAAPESFEWMPKPRYAIMRRYLPTRGQLGTAMMKLTCTVQCNIDYSSERDAFRKMRTAMAVTPVVTALFANSAQREGNDSGYRSWRQHIWTDVDPDRCGMLPFAFDETRDVFDAYTEWALKAPMFFIHRDGGYVDLAGLRFSDYARNGAQGYVCTESDWELHLSTLFPDVRLKRYLELRAADCVPPPLTMAVPALWVGLLYDDAALEEGWRLLSNLTLEQREALRDDAARLGLDARVGSQSMRAVAESVVQLAREGLERRNVRDEQGNSEAIYLDPLQAKLRADREAGAT
jgi:glutamate--cysteine ligase